MSIDEQTTQRTGRGTAVCGFTFVVLLLISAAMASVPGGNDSALKARNFYTEHMGVIVTAQVIGVVAALVFILLARALRDAWSTSPALELVGPSAFIALVLALSIPALARPRPS